MSNRFDPFAPFFRPVGRPALPIDAVERDGSVVVSVDLPGVAADAIEVDVEHRDLTIRAERPRQGSDDDKVLVAERGHGTYHRRIRLGHRVDTEAVSADYVDGVLTVTIPLRESATSRRIEVGAGAPELAEA